jgi:hypothetical protein
LKDELMNKLFLDNWPKRRRWMQVILAWALANAQYIIIWGRDSGLHENALIALLTLIASILGTYVFGATWDDRDKRRHFSRDRDREMDVTEGQGE